VSWTPCEHGRERYCEECAAQKAHAERPGLLGEIEDLEHECKELKAENERLRAKLKEYGL